MRIGDVVMVRGLRPRIDDKKGKLLQEMTYSAPKGEKFVVLLLGTVRLGEEFDAVAALNDLGWTSPEFPPKPPALPSPEKALGVLSGQSLEDQK